jgi:hypothetical protein
MDAIDVEYIRKTALVYILIYNQHLLLFAV